MTATRNSAIMHNNVFLLVIGWWRLENRKVSRRNYSRNYKSLPLRKLVWSGTTLQN